MAILHRATPVAVFCILICIGSSGYAQEELESQSASGLLAEASQILGEQNYEAAIPYLTEYLERMAGTEDGRVLAMTQKVRLKLGQIMDYLEDPFSAVEYLEKYIQELPLNEPREALKLLTVNLYESGQYEKCVSAATNALAQPLPKGLPGKQKIKYEELSKDEMGGFTVRQLNRIEKEAAEAGDKLSEGFSEEKALLEPDYTLEELVLLNMTLAEAYTAQENWQASIEPYAFVIENAAQEDRKGYAIMQMVNAMIKLEQYKEAGSLITQLYRTNARYDIRVNMALMTAGSALFDAGEPDSALMLYRMVLPREELVEYQAVKMNDLRQEAGLPSVEVSVVTNEMGRIETIFGHKQSEWILRQDEFSVSVALPAKPLELIQLEELVETLVALPPYENDVVYRTGQLYAEVDRSWEAVAALDLVADRDPEGELGQRAFADSLLVLVDPLEEYERVETRGKKFLNTHTEGLGPRRVAHALTSSYQKQERWAEVKALLPYIKRFAFSDDVVVRQYECELYYMQAIADLMLLNYELAGAGFAQVLADFPESHQQENATHWHAMTQLFLQNYEEALAEFEAYPSVYPSGSWLPEAAFHGGICLFSMGNLEGAQQQFTGVIKTYPDSRIYPDACSLRGDIFASQGMLNEAQRDYQEAIDSALNPKQDAYAVFQMVTMFEMEERYPEIITVIEGYLSRYGEEADVAKAAYWIGKIKLAQGLTDEAVKTYRETIVKYGGVIQQDGVDLIITELATLSKRLGDEALALLKESLRASADAADNETLRLRIWVLLARMNGSELELGRTLIAELSDLTQAPPPVLSVICEASFEVGDYSRAQEILTLFQARFEDSDFMRAAYKLRGHDLYTQGDLDAAMKIVEETQGLYGTQPDAVWAQLMKGRIELQRGAFDFARETFRTVLRIREWRGEPYAEATYALGEVEEAAGDLLKAFGWYQRVYFQYKGYAQGAWTADAYLASARCLQALGRENDRRNTFRAMLFDPYVNQLPQADYARTVLGPDEVLEISTMLVDGTQANLVVTIEAEGAE